MNDPLDSQSASPGKRAASARRLRALRGSTAALTVSLVIAFSATVANRHDLGEAASADAAQTTSGGSTSGGSLTADATSTVTMAQPERLVTRQS